MTDFETFIESNLRISITTEAIEALKFEMSTFYFEQDGAFNPFWLEALTHYEIDNLSGELFYRQLYDRFSGIRNILKFSSPDTWEKAKNLFKGYPHKGQVWLMVAIYNSFEWHGMGSKQYLTESNFQKWKSELQLSLEKTIEMLYSMPPNAFGLLGIVQDKTVDKLQEIAKLSHWNNFKADGFRIMGEPLSFQLLKILQESVSDLENDSGFFRKHINSQTSSRDFFMRKLTCGFLQETGKPNRALVADIVSSAFNCDLTIPEVVRATRDIDPKAHYSVVCFTTKDCLHNLGLYPDYQLSF